MLHTPSAGCLYCMVTILYLQENGIRVENYVIKCYNGYSIVWIGFEFICLLFVQAVALVLTILTRKVKIRVLNDSKEMIIIVYSTTIIMLILGVFTFNPKYRFLLEEIVFNGLVMLATTIFLGLLFVPKVHL